MKKCFYFPFVFSLVVQSSFSIGSLEELSTQAIFNSKTWSKSEKQKISNQLKSSKINPILLNFKGAILKDMDLSSMYLQNIDFSDCTFINVNLERCDLRGCKFKGATFKKVKLGGVLLFDGFLFNDKKSHLELVELYAQLITQAKEYDKSGDEDKKNEMYGKAQSLNQLFGPMSLRLDNANLMCLDLTGINFENARLTSSNLQGADLTNANLTDAKLALVELQNVRLSKDVIIPNYENISNLDIFNKWDNGSNEEQTSFQKLVNAHVPIFNNISNDRLRQVNWQKKDLTNAFLHCNLKNIDFSNVNLKNAYFDFGDFILKGTNFTNADLTNARFIFNGQIPGYKEGLILSETMTYYSDIIEKELISGVFFEKWEKGFLQEQKDRQLLVNKQLVDFSVVPYEILKHVNWQGKDLTNANLSKTNLSGLNLSNINLKGANLLGSNLKGTNFSNTNLKKVRLFNTQLQGANLKGANLNKTRLFAAVLSDSYKLGKNCDNMWIDLYNICPDPEAKTMLEQILIGKDLISDSNNL